VRSLQLSGLPQAEAQEILKAKGLVSTEDESRILIEYYAGNPLALKIATTTIQSLFGGDISASWSRVQSCLAIFGIFRPAVSSLVSFRSR